MPQRFAAGDELSLRHLPDVSDSSFSFQIPGMIQEENLLAETDQDFFGGADVTLAPAGASPLVTATSGGPLTISQLSPSKAVPQDTYKQFTAPPVSCDRVEAENAIPSPRRATKTRLERKRLPTTVPTSNGSIPRPKRRHNVGLPSPIHLPPGEGSPAIARLQNLRVEVESLGGDFMGGAAGSSSADCPQEPVFPTNTTQKPSGTSRPSIEGKRLLQRRETHRPRYNQKVIEGGIAKSRLNKGLSRIPCSDAVDVDIVPSQRDEIEHEQGVPASLLPDLSSPEFSGDASPSIANTSLTSLTTRGGVAERLVSYSQKLIGSFGIFGLDRSIDAQINRGFQDVKAGADDDEDIAEMHPQQEKKHEPEASHEIDIGNDIGANGPLTLSQLSPTKGSLPHSSPVPHLSPTPTFSAVTPGSPLRPSTKRPVSTELEQLGDDRPQHKRKKSKVGASSTVVAPEAYDQRQAPAAPPHHVLAPDSRQRTKPPVSGSGSASGSSSACSGPITIPRRQEKEMGRDRARGREAQGKVRERRVTKQIPPVPRAPQPRRENDGHTNAGSGNSIREVIGEEMGVGMVDWSETGPPSRTCVRLIRTQLLSKKDCDKDKDMVGPVNSLSPDQGKGATSRHGHSKTGGTTSIAKPRSRGAGLHDAGSVPGQTQPRVIAEGRSASSRPQSQSSNQYQSRSTESTSEMIHKHASSSQTQSRNTSQSRSTSQREKYSNLHPVPDFKAMHRAHQATASLRKENIQPTVPLPITFPTDLRVRERQKFDEMVKEKERERERDEEERRRAREEEDEMEVKELRKRLVVKAHDVPEWYREAPRTKRRERDGLE